MATTRFTMQLEMDSLCTVTWRLNLVQRGLYSYLGALKIRVSRTSGAIVLVLVISITLVVSPRQVNHHYETDTLRNDIVQNIEKSRESLL